MKLSNGGKKSNKKLDKDDNPDSVAKQKKKVEGVLQDFYISNKLCIAFNKGQCGETADHLTSQGTSITHNCGTCLKLNLGVVPDHSAKACPNKQKLFRGKAGK